MALSHDYLVAEEDAVLVIGCGFGAGGLSLKSMSRGARKMNSRMMVTMTS
jgi:hypothetical protein